MRKIFKKLVGSKDLRQQKKLNPIVDEINEYFETFQSLSDDDLKAKTVDFKERLKEAVKEIEEDQEEIRRTLRGSDIDADAGGDGQPVEKGGLTLSERHDMYAQLDDLEKEWLEVTQNTLDDILPEAFAVVKETCRRMIGKEWEAGGATIRWDMVPYDVQLIGGIVLHRGNIAEMKTGEGKTLVAVLPVYLNALVERGVHIVTVNSYLAQRDSEWMAPIYEFHGMTVACIDAFKPHSPERRAAYRADITFGTNNEFGFDYLRDNSFVIDPEQLVQRKHHFAIVDEVDSVLVDEARTPLIISGPVPKADESRFNELNPHVLKLVKAQQRLVAQLVGEAEKALEMRDDAEAAGDKKAVGEHSETAGLALLRASRGFAKNKKLVKLKAETGMSQLIQKTEYFYLQDNAKNMPFVDDELYYALDEKQRSIEMTDKGRELIANSTQEEVDFFVIPDMGDEIAKIESRQAELVQELEQSVANMTDLSDEKRTKKLDSERRDLDAKIEEEKRELYNKYSLRSERIHSVQQLLKAYTLFERDTEYILQDGKVMIVDEHTGRVMEGRRYSDGLHQAIEAKEGVKVERATQTYATITLQNYFRLYAKLAGMTGTAETEAAEFFDIYKLDVSVIPTNKPIARADLEDLLYRSKREKYNAVIEKIREYQDTGQPVLVGTASVEASETVSRMLTRAKIAHNVLNARQDRAKSEALIVSEAGQKGAVTIATNMAGRGTDIKLGEGIKELGGLAILGTERHESRRIDLQLRGRSGRQGDPGESQFYVSLEDDLMRLFGQDRTARVMDRLGLEEGEVITSSLVTKTIEKAQKKVEQNNFSIRKRQLDYDDVLNAQREVIYDKRMHALKGDRLRGDILDMLQQTVDEIVSKHYDLGDISGLRSELLRTLAIDLEIDRETFASLGEDGVQERAFNAANDFYNRKRAALAGPFLSGVKQLVNSDLAEKPERLLVDFTDGRRLLRASVEVEEAIETEGMEVNDALERTAVLASIDEKWTEHLRELDELKQGIGLRAYGQKDPLLEYKMEAFKAFEQLLKTIGEDVASTVLKAGPLADKQKQNQTAKVRGAKSRLDASRAKATHSAVSSGFGAASARGANPQQRKDPTAKATPIRNDVKAVGRNQPCPCGSGKKYKHCHGRG